MSRRRLEGARIVAVAAVAVAAMVAVVLAVHGTGRDGIAAGVRWTARSSLALFLPTFVASALVTLRPRPATKWLLRNRRYLGLSFAVSHGAHLALIIALAPGLDMIALGGVIGYVLLAAMVVTSTDAAQARLGRRRWRALHLTGMYALFAIFTFTYLGRAVADPAFTPPVAALAAAWGLRLAAWWRRARKVSSSPTAVRDSDTRRAS